MCDLTAGVQVIYAAPIDGASKLWLKDGRLPEGTKAIDHYRLSSLSKSGSNRFCLSIRTFDLHGYLPVDQQRVSKGDPSCSHLFVFIITSFPTLLHWSFSAWLCQLILS